MDIINDNMKKMYGKYTSDIKEFIKNLNRIKKELEGLQR